MAIRDILQPLKDVFRMGAVWATGRVVTSIALVAASIGVGLEASWIPMLVLPIAAVASYFQTEIMHGYREKQILKGYREEIGAAVGIDPKAVSIEHLYLVAEGSPAFGIRPNKTITEALNKNDSNRVNWMVANGLSALATMVIASSALIGDGFLSNMLAGAGLESAGEASSWIKSELLYVSAGSGMANFLLSSGLGFLGKEVFDINKRTINDKIREISREHKKGFNIVPEQVFDIYVDNNPEISSAIKNHYNAEYSELPHSEQKNIVKLYDKELGIVKLTNLINTGQMKATELAFISEGQASGVPLGKAKDEGKNITPEQPTIEEHIASPKTDEVISYVETPKSAVVSNIITAKQGKNSGNQSYVERYASDTQNKPQSHAEQIQEEKDRIVDQVTENVSEEASHPHSFTKDVLDIGKQVGAEIVGLR